MFKKNKKVETPNTNNNEALKENKKDKKTKNPAVNNKKAPIGYKQDINMFTDFLEPLMDANIVSFDVIEQFYNKGLKLEPKIINVIDALIEIDPKIETKIINIIKNRFNLPGKQNGDKVAAVSIVDMFHNSNPLYIGDAEVNKILQSGILPISIVENNKKRYIDIVTRTPEISPTIISDLEPIMKKKKAIGINSVSIVDKDTFDEIYRSLTNFEYSNEL